MADNLHLLGAGKIGDLTGEIAGIEDGAREEIEINRLPMAQTQRQCRAAV